jgi:hypothetical protein
VIPSTVVELGLVLLAVLPGAIYTWTYEREAGSFGVSFADRTLRFLAVSVLGHLVLGWPEFLIYRHTFAHQTGSLDAASFAAIWIDVVLLVVIPGSLGTILGGLYATRTSRGVTWPRIRRRLGGAEDRLLRVLLGRDPAPRAWDDLFAARPSVYLRVRTTDGIALAGRFANRSYAGGYPNDPDLLIEDAYSLTDNGDLNEALGYAYYIAAGQIAWLEIIPEAPE